MTTRREFVGNVAGAAGAFALRGLPLGAGAALLAPARAALAAGVVYDPVPDPIAAGWTKEGSEVYIPVLPFPLVINDANAVPNPAFPQPFCNFYVDADALFAAEIVLNANVQVDVGFVPDSIGSSGVHVTINDGFQQIRAALLQNGAGGVRVAVLTQGGFSAGVDLNAPGGTFSVRRMVDGSCVLQVGGEQETTLAADLPGSGRPNQKTLEFGTYDTSAASVSRWRTLGLPMRLVNFPITAAITALQLKPSGAEKVQIDLDFTLDAASDGINPPGETVSLQLFKADGTRFYPSAFGGLVNAFAPTTDGWSISDPAKHATGIQAFNIKRTDDPRTFEIHYVDTRMGLVPDPLYRSITAALAIGNDSGSSATTAPRQYRNGDWVFP